MPRIAELKIIDDELWARVGKEGEFVNGIGLYTPEEIDKKYKSGWSDCIYFQPNWINFLIRKFGKKRP